MMSIRGVDGKVVKVETALRTKRGGRRPVRRGIDRCSKKWEKQVNERMGKFYRY